MAVQSTSNEKTPLNKKSLTAAALCLAAIIAVFAAFCELGAATDRARDGGCGSNEGDYLAGAVTMHMALSEGRPPTWLLNPGYIMAPLQLILAQPLFALENHDMRVMRRLNLVYLFALLCATCALTARLFGKPAGVLAALILASFNSTYTVAWFYNQLILTALFITLTIWLLLESNRLRNKKFAFLAGLSMAAALISHRGSPLLMLAPPVALYFLISMLEIRGRSVIYGLLILLTTAAIPAFGHIYHYYSLKVLFTVEQVEGGLTQHRDLLHFVKTLHSLQLTKFIGWFWPFAALALLIKGNKDRRLWILLAAALPPLAWFGVFATKNDDYIYPVIPMFAVIIAGAVKLIPHKIVRRIVYGAAVVIAVFIGFYSPRIYSRPGAFNVKPIIYKLSKHPVMSFASSAPGLNESCEDLAKLLEQVEKGSAVLLHVAYPGDTENGDPMSTMRDLFVCGALKRTDLPAAQLGLDGRTDDNIQGEIWVYRKNSPHYDEALTMAKIQARTEPGSPAFWSVEKLGDKPPPPPRPEGDPVLFPNPIYEKMHIAVYGMH